MAGMLRGPILPAQEDGILQQKQHGIINERISPLLAGNKNDGNVGDRQK